MKVGHVNSQAYIVKQLRHNAEAKVSSFLFSHTIPWDLAPSIMAPSMVLSPLIEPYYSKSIERKYQLRFGTGRFRHEAPQPRGAKIEYLPNWNEFIARRARRLLAGGVEAEVPEGWPARLSGRMAWKGQDFDGEDEFAYRLSEQEKVEIDEALKHFKGQSNYRSKSSSITSTADIHKIKSLMEMKSPKKTFRCPPSLLTLPASVKRSTLGAAP